MRMRRNVELMSRGRCLGNEACASSCGRMARSALEQRQQPSKSCSHSFNERRPRYEIVLRRRNVDKGGGGGMLRSGRCLFKLNNLVSASVGARAFVLACLLALMSHGAFHKSRCSSVSTHAPALYCSCCTLPLTAVDASRAPDSKSNTWTQHAAAPTAAAVNVY
jgi:hypothetical protein